MCARFALLSGDRGIDKLKLIKLVYLTERRFLKEHRMPMLYDELYSLQHGPVCSNTLNGIDGFIDQDVWSQFIALHGRNKVFPVSRFNRDDLDEISDAEMDAIEAAWEEFGRMSAWDIRDYSHEHCAEYTEVSGGRVPISYRDVIEALGEPDPDEVEREVRQVRRAESVLAR